MSEVESNYGATEEDLKTSASKTEETLSKKREYQSSSSVSSTSSSYSSSSESRFSESIGEPKNYNNEFFPFEFRLLYKTTKS